MAPIRSQGDLDRAAVRLARFLQDPARLWPARRDPDQAILQAARSLDADAVAYFGDAVILACAATESALTADLGPEGKPCRWCHAYQRAGKVGQLPPVNPATLKLLGASCDRCAKVNMGRVLHALEGRMAENEAPEPVAAAAGPQPSVRDLIRLARRRQREREAAYPAAAEELRGG